MLAPELQPATSSSWTSSADKVAGSARRSSRGAELRYLPPTPGPHRSTGFASSGLLRRPPSGPSTAVDRIGAARLFHRCGESARAGQPSPAPPSASARPAAARCEVRISVGSISSCRFSVLRAWRRGNQRRLAGGAGWRWFSTGRIRASVRAPATRPIRSVQSAMYQSHNMTPPLRRSHDPRLGHCARRHK